jgi:ABC-2 type transport system ATP-binding protein
VLQFTLGFFRGAGDIHSALVDRLDLKPILHARMRTLSKGQRKRALLAVGLLTPQPLLLIDEPFDGLDLRQIREAVETLRWCSSNGRTLFLSVHQIADAARICHRFVLLNGGRVCAEGSAQELTDLAAHRTGKTNPGDFEEVFLALT